MKFNEIIEEEDLTEKAFAKFGKDGMSKEARLERAKSMGFDIKRIWYHGSRRAGFKKFEMPSSGSNTNGTGVFFTSDERVARSYSSSNDLVGLHHGSEILDDPSLIDGLEIFKEYSLYDKNGNSAISGTYDTPEEVYEVLEDEGTEIEDGEYVGIVYHVLWPNGYEGYYSEDDIVDELDKYEIDMPGNYEVYLKRFKNDEIWVIDWEGRNWDDAPETDWQLLDADGEIVDWAYSEEEAVARMENEDEIVDFRANESGRTTNDLAKDARDMDMKAIYFKNIVDVGSDGYGTEESNVLVVFDPAYIRSTNAAFDPDQKNSGNIMS